MEEEGERAGTMCCRVAARRWGKKGWRLPPLVQPPPLPFVRSAAPVTCLGMRAQRLALEACAPRSKGVVF
jgi:hypothetical protein